MPLMTADASARKNGYSDRQCRSKSAFEPIQSSVWVMRQARYGLRGERVGEASNPGPDHEVEGVAPTQEDSDAHGSGIVHFNLIQRDAPTEKTCSDTESSRSRCDICHAQRATSKVGLG